MNDSTDPQQVFFMENTTSGGNMSGTTQGGSGQGGMGPGGGGPGGGVGGPFGGGIPPFLLDCNPIPPITPAVIDRIQREFVDGEMSATVNATKAIWNSVPMIFFIIGMLGNILTVVIIVRQRRMTSTTVYLLALAFSDMMLLCNAPLRQWVRYTYTEIDENNGLPKEKNWRHWSEAGCKISLYLTYSSLHLSSWILVAVTMERVISVLLPHRVKLGSTIKSSVIVISTLVVIILAINSHYLYGYGRSDLPIFNGLGYCEAKYQDYYDFINKVWPWLDFVVTFAVPFVFLVTGNALIIYKLRRTRLQRRKMSVVMSKSNQAFEKDAKVLTITLVLLAVVFCVCLTPIQIYLIVVPYRLQDIDKIRCEDILAWRDAVENNELWYAITNCLGYLNASFNFVLYVISGSKFREEIKSLILCRRPGRDAVFGTSTNDSSMRMARSNTGSTEFTSTSFQKSQL